MIVSQSGHRLLLSPSFQVTSSPHLGNIHLAGSSGKLPVCKELSSFTTLAAVGFEPFRCNE